MTWPGLSEGARWADLLLVSVLAAGLFAGSFGNAVRWRARRLRLCIGVLILLCGTVGLIAQTLSVTGESSISALDGAFVQIVAFETSFGQSWLLRQSAGVLVIFLSFFGSSAIVAWAIYLPLAITLALFGHPVAASSPLLTLTVNSVHLIGLSLWGGGLLALTTAPTLGASDLIRFSRVATFLVIGITVTGAGLIWLITPSLTGLVSSAYGWLLFLKLVLFGTISLVAWKNHRVVNSWKATRSEPDTHPGSEGLDRRIRWELVGIVLLIAVAV